MPCALLYDVPADPAMYRRVKSLIGDERPDGLISHTVVAAEGGLRHFEVWESRSHFDRFHDERVEPAVHAILRAAGLTEMPPDPPVVELDLVDYWVGEPARMGAELDRSATTRAAGRGTARQDEPGAPSPSCIHGV